MEWILVLCISPGWLACMTWTYTPFETRKECLEVAMEYNKNPNFAATCRYRPRPKGGEDAND